MHLDKIETFVVANPPPRHGGRYFIFVRLTTACGITGVGEIYNATFGPDLVAAMAVDMFSRHFEGSDPHHIERLWRQSDDAGPKRAAVRISIARPVTPTTASHSRAVIAPVLAASSQRHSSGCSVSEPSVYPATISW